MALMVHATCVALEDPAAPATRAGVLIRGASGAGKSDLALRLIDEGAALVADDRVILERDGEGLRARRPPTIAGLIEARGLGVVRIDAVESVLVRLVVDPEDPAAPSPRLPAERTAALAGVDIPAVTLEFAAASASARVRLALRAVRLGLFADAATRLDEGSN